MNITHSDKSKVEVIQDPNEKKIKERSDFKKLSPPPEKPQKSSHDDGSKNLANFFNGEIIDLDE